MAKAVERTAYRDIKDAHSKPVAIRNYREGDESEIVSAFNAVFNTQRSLVHWQWKYLDNPCGQAWIASAWDEHEVVAQYAGYPVQLYLQNKIQMSCQAADAFTRPSHRKVGHGSTSLISQTFYHYENHYCEQRLALGYGFNTSKIQKLGKLFWQHQVIAPVFQHHLPAAKVVRMRKLSSWWPKLQGYKVVHTRQAGAWANQIFEQVKDAYGWLLLRDQTYLNWRYFQHPEFVHDCFVVYHKQQAVGWIVGRQKDNQWLWGDALFVPGSAHVALPLALQCMLTNCPAVTEVDSWFAEVPAWWNLILAKLGFAKKRQHQQLDLIVRFYLARVEADKFARNFYFTWGDSDLF